MVAVHANPAAGPTVPAIPVRKLTPGDLNLSLREGWNDFLSMRGDLLIVGMLYPLIGIAAAVVTLGYDLVPVLFPIVAGISLLGPLVAVGFYELAHRREAGLESDWSHFFDVRKRPSIEDIGAVAALLIAIFVLWVAAAAGLYMALWGANPDSVAAFVTRLFTTAEGWTLIVVGNLVGACFAVLVMAISFVSLPMLVDCDIDARTAVYTSFRAFLSNKRMMIRWGVMIAVLLILGSIPLFIGLAVVLPWLGYATWHLYTHVIDRNALKVYGD